MTAPTTEPTAPTTRTAPTTPRRGRNQPTRQQLAEHRAEKLTEIHTQLADAVAAAATDDGWRAWLAAAARFRTYSPFNQMLILAQAPDATRVAGYRVWQSLGRQVRKGAKGITVLAPIRRRAATDTRQAPDADTAADTSRPDETPDGATPVRRSLAGFTTATVFDLAQTDGTPLPEYPAIPLPEGDAPTGLWDGLREQVETHGYTVTRDDPAPAWGRTRYAARRVDIAPDLSPAMACHTLAHELGHIAADHEIRHDVARGVREAEADGIAYLLTTAAGLPGTFTVNYVTGWTGGDPAIVRATATRVVAIAAQLLDALSPTPDDQDTPTTPHT